MCHASTTAPTTSCFTFPPWESHHPPFLSLGIMGRDVNLLNSWGVSFAKHVWTSQVRPWSLPVYRIICYHQLVTLTASMAAATRNKISKSQTGFSNQGKAEMCFWIPSFSEHFSMYKTHHMLTLVPKSVPTKKNKGKESSSLRGESHWRGLHLLTRKHTKFQEAFRPSLGDIHMQQTEYEDRSVWQIEVDPWRFWRIHSGQGWVFL